MKVPNEVAPAQQDAIKAREDKDRMSLAAQAYSNDLIPRARGAGVRQVQEAQAYRSRKIANAEGEASRFIALLNEYERAPAVTRERLYLETIEDVLASSKKVVLDTPGGGTAICSICPSTSCSSRAVARRVSARRRGEHDVEAPIPPMRQQLRRSPHARDALMASRGFLILILAAVVAFTLAMSTFTVRETDLAIKFRFGEIVRADYGPGLHFMVPMVNNIRKFERRIDYSQLPL